MRACQLVLGVVMMLAMLSASAGSAAAQTAPQDDSHAGHDHSVDDHSGHRPAASHDGRPSPLALMSASDLDAFARQVDLAPLRSLSVQHNQTLKTLDSYSRQMLSEITGKTSLDGHSALFVVLDIARRPEAYANRNILKIKNVPLRKDFDRLSVISPEEKQRILEEGTISIQFFMSPPVRELMQQIMAEATFKAEKVQQLQRAANALMILGGSRIDLVPADIVPPPTGGPEDTHWHRASQMVATVLAGSGAAVPADIHGHGDLGQPIPGYEGRIDVLSKVIAGNIELHGAWRRGDAARVNAVITELASVLPMVTPAAYPSELKRSAEVLYNRMFKLTLPGAAVYFIAFVCFIAGAYSGATNLRLWGLRLLVVGFLVHTVGIAVRWWLVEKSVGNWFEAIPIKNQFESVLFSAWFGALVGVLLETWRNKGFFGAAASFVGWLSLVAIFAAPYVTGREIGGEISQVNGVLMSYWLYIHVTMVVAAYALIGMSFLLGVWWLGKYFLSGSAVLNTNRRKLSADGANFDDDVFPAGGSITPGGAVTIGFAQTLLAMLFISRSKDRPAAVAQARQDPQAERKFLAMIDLCNMVILQLAFWILGVGIILGAVWADQSWGRPWGWDPKETFALVTWIVYLAVVHIRLMVDNKAWWTSVLSIIGFFVMLFNWIGVNFFLVGLHSYA